jgi:glycosyltransferase involved in cell wall biosynthesis
MQKKIYVLHIVQGMNRGGIETMIMNYFRNINREKIQFDFLIYNKEKCDYEDEIIMLGGRIHRISPLNVVSIFNFCFELNALLKNYPEYKIIHSHINTLSSIPLFVAKIRKIPFRISHAHIGRADVGLKGLLKKFVRIPLRSVANIYFSCGNLAAEYVFGSWFYNHKNSYFVKNAVEANKFDFNENIRDDLRSKLKINNEVVFGNVGRLNYQKNQVFILEVFKEIKQKLPNSILFLIGEGENMNLLKNKAKELRLNKSVVFTGVVENVNEYLNAFDVFLFPSLFEGLSLSLIEAQASGLICYCSDAIDMESDITNQVHFLSLENDANVWSDYILKTYENNVRRSYLNEIKTNGYDISTASYWLEEFYLKL